jgi:anti-sigma factor RsiW
MTEGADPSAMECRQIAELLGDYLDGSLPTHLRELLEWHIEGCPPCVAFVNTYRGTVTAAASLRDVQIPPELRQRLLAVLRSARG